MYRSTLTHKEHNLEVEAVTLTKTDEQLAAVISGGDVGLYDLAKKTFLEVKTKEAVEAAIKEHPAEPQVKTYSDDWYGRQQKEKDDRLKMVKNIMNKA